MGDKEDGHAHLLLQIPDKVEDLGLDRYIQGRGGLVGDQDIGFVDQSHGNHDPLPFPAGQLVGK